MAEFLCSVSRLALYRACPMAFERKYILKEPEVSGDFAELGRAFHAYAAARESGRIWPPYPETLPPALLTDWEQLKRAFDAQTWDDSRLVGVEEPMSITWEDGEYTVKFRSVIDRLEVWEDRAKIYDRKTGWKVPNAEELRDDLQLAAYAVVVAEHYPQAQVFELEQVQYRYGGRSVATAFSREELVARRRELVAEVGRMVRATRFLPSPTCTICPPTVHARAIQPYQQVSLEFAEGKAAHVSVAMPNSPEEAERVAWGVKLAEGLAHAGKAALARWSADQGPVALGAGAYGHWGSEKQECSDVTGFRVWLETNGLSEARYMRPDTGALRRLLKDYPQASQYFVARPRSTFGWRSQGGKAQAKTERIKDQLAAPFELRVVEGGST